MSQVLLRFDRPTDFKPKQARRAPPLCYVVQTAPTGWCSWCRRSTTPRWHGARSPRCTAQKSPAAAAAVRPGCTPLSRPRPVRQTRPLASQQGCLLACLRLQSSLGCDRATKRNPRPLNACRLWLPALPGHRGPSPSRAGTVCVLGVAGPRGEAALQRVVQRYSLERRYEPKVFRGSSAGAAEFGHLVLRRRGGTA